MFRHTDSECAPQNGIFEIKPAAEGAFETKTELMRSVVSSLCRPRVGLGVLALLTLSESAVADDPSVPLRLQADLAAKVMAYVQQPPLRSVDRIHIGILLKPGSAESTRFGVGLKAAFEGMSTIAGLPHDEVVLQWSNGNNLIDQARHYKLFSIYVTPGFDSEVPVIARALQGMQLVTVAASDDYVARGIVLGFELISGHPKMVFNLSQAKRQSVVFSSTVMKLMRVVE
jgi:YfiR/HmsC-like